MTQQLDELTSLVITHADADAELTDDAAYLILGALQGDAELDDALTAIGASGRPPLPTSTDDDDEPGEPARAFLTEVTVQGFRGVGPIARMTFAPGPGLTVVAGRNGCGKSSFVEALEVAVTGASVRWGKKNTVFKDAWRNLHDGTSAQVRVGLAVEDTGRTLLGADWPDDATNAEQVSVWAQQHGSARLPWSDLGWDVPVTAARPFLTYDDYTSLFAEPSKLHDAIAPVLGLGRLDDAVGRLGRAKREASAHDTEAKARKKTLRALLAGSADPRAAVLDKQAGKYKPDLDAVAALVVGNVPDVDAEGLRQLAGQAGPDLPAWRAARDALDAASSEHARAQRDAAAAASTSVGLLRAALAHRDRHGDGPCPVCRVGTLDASWAEQATAAVNEAGQFDSRLADTDAAVQSARRALQNATPGVPPALTADVAEVPSLVSAASAWSRWCELAASRVDTALVTEAHAKLLTALDHVREEAGAAVRDKDAAWRPLALAGASWLESARAAQECATTVAALDAADAWLRTRLDSLRHERLAPIAAQAAHIWSLLRQESNVDLGGLTLTGTATRRKLTVHAKVDDSAETQAFSVMSQGELMALALALFLPRATSPESPFGFVVVDDPVQSMDPAKVDGLARVLAEAAQTRQVIVFTHDDRLPEAVQRLQIPARILEVTRDPSSVVMVSSSSLPHQRLLADARAVVSDPNVPADVVARVVPTLCRLALESAVRDLFYRRELLAGRTRDDVEAKWQAAERTRARVALLVCPGGGEPNRWAAVRPHRRCALDVSGRGVHQGLTGDPQVAIAAVRDTIADLQRSHG